MKTGQEWIESSERRAVELGVLGGLGVPVGVAALAAGVALKVNDPDSPLIHHVARSRFPGDEFMMPKLSDPRSAGKLATLCRKAMLDEAPQLALVGTGEMTLWGPRSDNPHFIDKMFEAVDDPGLRSEWEYARSVQKAGFFSAYAIESHRRNLAGRPEAERFVTAEEVHDVANRRAALEVADFEKASLAHDIRLLVDTAHMVCTNYSKYAGRITRRLVSLGH